MRVAVLGSTGAVGSLLVTTALGRGLRVTALARDPRRVPDLPGLTRVAAEAHDAASIAEAVRGSDVLVSGLGVSKGSVPGTLAAGAAAAVASGVPRIVWLGAYGTGRSAAAAGPLTRTLLTIVMGGELPDKVAADTAILAAGGTVFHAGPMSGGPAAHRAMPLDAAPRRLFPSGVSRAAVAAAMIDEVVTPRFAGGTAVVLGG